MGTYVDVVRMRSVDVVESALALSTMHALALAAALLACVAGKHIAEDPYQHTLLKHHSFKTPDQIRSPLPLFHVKDGRDNSFAVPESY